MWYSQKNAYCNRHAMKNLHVSSFLAAYTNSEVYLLAYNI